MMIDWAQGGNVTRHLNHACEPNVEAIEEYNEADELVVVICATRNIDGNGGRAPGGRSVMAL